MLMAVTMTTIIIIIMTQQLRQRVIIMRLIMTSTCRIDISYSGYKKQSVISLYNITLAIPTSFLPSEPPSCSPLPHSDC